MYKSIYQAYVQHTLGVTLITLMNLYIHSYDKPEIPGGWLPLRESLPLTTRPWLPLAPVYNVICIA